MTDLSHATAVVLGSLAETANNAARAFALTVISGGDKEGACRHALFQLGTARRQLDHAERTITAALNQGADHGG